MEKEEERKKTETEKCEELFKWKEWMMEMKRNKLNELMGRRKIKIEEKEEGINKKTNELRKEGSKSKTNVWMRSKLWK